MLVLTCGSTTSLQFSAVEKQIRNCEGNHSLRFLLLQYGVSSVRKLTEVAPLTAKAKSISSVKHTRSTAGQSLLNPVEKQIIKNSGKKEHHLWRKRDSTSSGKKALNLVHIVSGLPNEKEAVYGALNKWTAWETEFPVIAAAKALRILRKRRQWVRLIQVAKWMLSKGQGITMGTYDSLLLAFDLEGRLEEAETLWNMILHTYTRSVSKQLFSRMISLYDHHNMPEKTIEVFAGMEELGVKPDENTIKRVAYAFKKLGQEEKQNLVLDKYRSKWKYLYFKGERVRVKADPWDE